MENIAEVYETPFGEVCCGACGYELECDENGDMPENCPDCGVELNYSYYDEMKPDSQSDEETMSKEMTVDECLEIFRKYDFDLYHYYYNNMWYFGPGARRYAEYLKKQKEENIAGKCVPVNGEQSYE